MRLWRPARCFILPFAVHHKEGWKKILEPDPKYVPLRNLVTKPLTVFAKRLGKDGELTTHEKHQCHRNAVKGEKDFLKTFHPPGQITAIVNELSSNLAATKASSRKQRTVETDCGVGNIFRQKKYCLSRAPI